MLSTSVEIRYHGTVSQPAMDVQYLRQRSTYGALGSADSRIVNCQLSTTELVIKTTQEESNFSLQFYTTDLVTSTYSHAEVSIQNTCNFFSKILNGWAEIDICQMVTVI